jgi:hypothetical protein
MTGRAGEAMRSALGFVAALVMAGALVMGCDATRRDERTCYQNTCSPGQGCTLDHKCVPVFDGGAWDTSPIDSAHPIDIAIDDAPGRIDGAAVDVFSLVDVGADVPVPVGAIDAAAVFDSAGEVAGFVDASPVDAYTPDAAGTCGSDIDCTSKDAPYCAQGRCVPCKTGDQCGGGAPICSSSYTCVSCAAVDAGCPSATPACEADSGRCLECLVDGDCLRDASKSFCRAGTCVGCAAAGDSACAGRNPAKPVCMPGGTCAECATSDDCSVTAKPICDTTANVCVACSRDDQCQVKVGGPGVCLFQQDGRCATDAESVYVGRNGAGICSDAGAGTAQIPYCSASTAIGVAKRTGKPVLALLGPVQGTFAMGALSAALTVVGKNAVIIPVDSADGIDITSGELYLRSLTVAGNALGATGIGVNAQAATGTTVVLHMDGCTIKNNPGGGIFLAGTAFDIRNSKVTGNGPGQTTGGTIWGGIRVEGLPVGGQANLDLVTIQNNLAVGLTCSGAIQGQGVLISGNTPLDIATSCGAGVLTCTTPAPTCGAQP